ncbi:Interferon-induced transmembrane protein 1 [Chelonia mydas]|uniref:Interferon-induced transmembrane protein 1 n=1 Tax=Chelonia mydas TaxID=8469 RepID=M7BN32_CHEMY|nr:Interferon-induced transmembrane protein 1 [Chelonia mydas]
MPESGNSSKQHPLACTSTIVLLMLLTKALWSSTGLDTGAFSAALCCARDRKVLGDANGAGSYGKTAKCLNIAVLVLSILTVILIIVLVATGAVAVSQTIQQGSQNKNNYGFNYGN